MFASIVLHNQCLLLEGLCYQVVGFGRGFCRHSSDDRRRSVASSVKGDEQERKLNPCCPDYSTPKIFLCQTACIFPFSMLDFVTFENLYSVASARTSLPNNAAIGPSCERTRAEKSKKPTTCTHPSDAITHNLIHHHWRLEGQTVSA